MCLHGTAPWRVVPLLRGLREIQPCGASCSPPFRGCVKRGCPMRSLSLTHHFIIAHPLRLRLDALGVEPRGPDDNVAAISVHHDWGPRRPLIGIHGGELHVLGDDGGLVAEMSARIAF